MNKSKFFAAIGILALYIVSSVHFSRMKPLWEDELYGLSASVHPDVNFLILKGAPGQGSPAPLYYLCMKAFEPLGRSLLHAGLSDLIVWRLPTLAFMLLGALLYLWRHRESHFYPSLIILACFLFAKEAFYYASEARPYGLWLMACFLFLDEFRAPYSEVLWIVLCLTLGLTATASIFLFVSAICAVLATSLLKRGDKDGKFYRGIIVGTVVSLYYSLHVTPWHYILGTWPEFLRFYASYKWPVIASVYLVIQDYIKRTDDLSGSLTLFLWFAVAPAIFEATRMKGFFYSERQYIFWVAAAAVIADRLYRNIETQKDIRNAWAPFLFLLLCIKRLNLPASVGRIF